MVGLEWSACLALARPGLDHDRVVHSLRCWEEGLIKGCAESARRSAEAEAARRDFEGGR